MRNETDLREALASRKDLAPGPDPVLEGMQGAIDRRRRRTRATMVAATIAVAAAITVPAVLAAGGPEAVDPVDPAVGAQPDAPPPPQIFGPPAWEPFTFMVDPGTVAGFALEPAATAPEYQLAELTPVKGDGPTVQLTIYAPGTSTRVDWDVTPNPTETEVGGVPAWFSSRDGVSALRWEYAPGAFAVLTTETGDTAPVRAEAAMWKAAAAIEFMPPYPVMVPYRLDYLPDGMAPFSVMQDLDGDTPQSTLQMAAGDAVMDISIGENWLSENPGWDWQETTIAGHPAQCADIMDGRRCEVELDGLVVGVGGSDLTDDQLAQLIAGMTVATLEDPGTWYDLPDALP